MNSGMTKKERVLAALYKKETDRIPFSPLCDDYFASSLEKQNHPYDLLRALRYIGADIIERHSPCCEVRRRRHYGRAAKSAAAREKRILSQNTANLRPFLFSERRHVHGKTPSFHARRRESNDTYRP
ncbi:MAG: hypothetical protein ACLRTQ_12610 [Candidatus Borkfalkia sp.]